MYSSGTTLLERHAIMSTVSEVDQHVSQSFFTAAFPSHHFTVHKSVIQGRHGLPGSRAGDAVCLGERGACQTTARGATPARRSLCSANRLQS